MSRLYLSGLFFTCLFLFSLQSATLAQPGLEGKELRQDLDGKQLIGSLLEKLLYGGNFKGSIGTVKVVKDENMSLTLAITYSGFEEGYFHISAAGEGGQIITGVQPVKTLIDISKQQMEIRLSAYQDRYGDSDSLIASKLVVLVSKNENGSHGIKNIYTLDKIFTIRAEDFVIAVNLVPIQAAGLLPATLPSNTPNPVFTKPVRKVKMIDKPLYYKNVPLAISTNTRTTGSSVPATSTGKETSRPVVSHARLMQPVSLHVLAERGTAPATNKNPQGPDNNPISFWGDFITADVDFESQSRITNVSLNVYPDKNPASGIFYYLPIAYDLKYNREKGFSFFMDYGTARAESGENKVRMSGTLTSGITLFETQFINNLVDMFKKQHPEIKVERAVPMPVSERPTITLGDELKNFGITSVSINNNTSVSDPVEFAWLADATTASEIESLLKANSGITGTMKIKPSTGNVPLQEIPVRIRLIDENTFGRFGMTPSDFRNKNWRNETPFPVRLKYLHYMIMDQNPVIYSWDMSNTEIPPQAQVKLNAETVPKWLDNFKGRQGRIWMEYSVVDTCGTCNEQVFSRIINSPVKSQLSDVTFRILPFFDEYGINSLDIEVRSMQGEPAGTTMTNFPLLHISRDSTDYPGGKLYVPNGQEPAYEYRVTAVTDNGAELQSGWVKRTSLNTPFGSFQLTELFPALKK